MSTLASHLAMAMASFVLSATFAVSALAGPAVREVRFSEVAPPPPTPADSDDYVLAWPFCPSDAPCSAKRLPAWVEMHVSMSAYSSRLTDPHDAIDRIVSKSHEDVAPIAQALRAYLEGKGDHSLRSRAAWAQGLSQSIQYAYDTATGVTDYPKFALEYLVDQNGDCDDAAIFTGALLENLGLQPYFVYWVHLKEPSGHLSTAVVRDADLAAVEPPTGHPLVERSKGAPLLHVDGVGSKTGCKSGCGILGWNDWHLHNLRVEQVVAVSDPGLARAIPLHVWRAGSDERLDRTLADRRNLKPGEIVFPPISPAVVEARERARLQSLGVEEEVIQLAVAPRWAGGTARFDDAYVGMSVVISASLLLAGFGGVRGARRRRAAAHQRRGEKRRRLF